MLLPESQAGVSGQKDATASVILTENIQNDAITLVAHADLISNWDCIMYEL